MESHDYTSATISFTPGANASEDLVYLDDRVLASLPGWMNRVTIGNLAPGGNTYTLKITAQGAGVETAPTSTVSVTTLSFGPGFFPGPHRRKPGCPGGR